MPYFNPKPLVFNPDNKVIEASGAIGQSLFEIMKENTKREQENARLAEAKRANLQNEAMKEKQFDFDNTKFDYAKQKDERDFTWDRQKWQTQFNAEQAHRKNQQSLGWANYNLRANELAKQEALRQAELQRQQEAENLQNMAYFDYGVKNGAFGDIANSQEFANLTPQQKASYGANLKAQMNAQGQIYKANEPLFKMQEQERARQEALRQEQARNLQIAQMAYENPSDFGLNKQEIALLGEIQKRANSGDTQAQADLMEIGGDFSQKLQTQSEINKNLGIKPMTADEKSNIAKMRTTFAGLQKELRALDKAIQVAGNVDSFFGGHGISNLGGLGDSIAYAVPSWSADSAEYQSKVRGVATEHANNQKGQGKFNYEKINKELQAGGILGVRPQVEALKAHRTRILNDIGVLAREAEINGAKEANEWLEFAKQNFIDEDEIEKYLYGGYAKGTPFGTANHIQDIDDLIDDLKEKAKKKLQYSDKGGTQSYYEQADKHGGHYME